MSGEKLRRFIFFSLFLKRLNEVWTLIQLIVSIFSQNTREVLLQMLIGVFCKS